MTNLNQQILEMIRSSEGHLTAEEAFMLAKKKKINISMASVYRILGKLADDGYIKRITVTNGPDIFDKTVESHAHLICSKCGKVKDVHISNLKNKLSKETNIEVDSYELCINYVCEDCKRRKK